MNAVADFLDHVRIGEPTSSRNLTLFPVEYDGEPGPEYDLLDVALEEGTATVGERVEGATVPTLTLRNDGHRPVLVIAGFGFVGGLQNRMANTSCLAGAGDTEVPVSCVEQGRWNSESRFRSGDMAHSKLRGQVLDQTSVSLHATHTYGSDQGAVWSEVRRLSSSVGSSSRTGDLQESFGAIDMDTREFERAFNGGEPCNGLLAGIDGRIVGFDMFDRKDTFERIKSKLFRSYLVQALERADHRGACSKRDAQAFLRRIGDAGPGRSYPSCALGDDYRWQSLDQLASALVHEGRVIHLMCFPRKKFSPWD